MTDSDARLGGKSTEPSSSLIVRLKQDDQEVWGKVVRIYGPVVFTWCRRAGLQEAEAAKVGQDVFRTVRRAVAELDFKEPGESFRGWLRGVTRTRIIDFLRLETCSVEAPTGDPTTTVLDKALANAGIEDSDEEYRLILVRRAVDLVLTSCDEHTRQVFLRVVIEGKHPRDVAQRLGLTVDAVDLAKAQVLRRLREAIGEIIDG